MPKLLRTQLDEILLDYEQIAHQDPYQLRLKIPAKEIWRFFIDGWKQEKGRNLSEHPVFLLSPLYAFFQRNSLSCTIQHCLKQGHLLSSALGKLLDSRKWILSEKEKEQFKLRDLVNLDKAWIPFERNEPGYLKGSGQGFASIFALSTPLTLSFIKNLHALAVGNVLNTNYEHNEGINEFRTTSFVSYRLVNSNTSRAGLYEFINAIASDTTELNELSILCNGEKCSFKLNVKSLALIEQFSHELIAPPDDVLQNVFIFVDSLDGEADNFHEVLPLIKKLISAKNRKQLVQYLKDEILSGKATFSQASTQHKDPNEVLNERMQSLIDVYQIQISVTEDPIMKLMAIINFIQSCEQLHPFRDGNCRTFCMLLLNHLLMKNGFPPAILDDPNKFDLCGRNELLHLVLDGMQNTLTLINTGSLYKVSTDKVLRYLETEDYLAPISSYFNEVVAAEELSRQTMPQYLERAQLTLLQP